MKIFDTHCHYNSEKYDNELIDVLTKCKNNGVDKIVLIGASIDDSIKEKQLCHELNDLKLGIEFYYTLGIHPDDIILDSKNNKQTISDLNEVEMAEYNKLVDLIEESLNDKHFVAIGEFGLDYYGEEKKDIVVKDNQKLWFKLQLDLAKKYNKPVVIHSRDAMEDTYEVLKNNLNETKGILHCYSYNKEIVDKFIQLGLYIGIGGVVTFKNGVKLKETVEHIDLDNMVLETDCPYLSPEPFRGTRNDSSNLPYVIKQIALLKNLDEEEVSNKLYENGLKIYNI